MTTAREPCLLDVEDGATLFTPWMALQDQELAQKD